MKRRKFEWYFPLVCFYSVIHATFANVNFVPVHFIYSVIYFLGCKVARETNEELRAIKADPTEGFDIGAILSIAKRYSFKALDSKLSIIV
jgi:hypothetical protein